MLKTQSLIAILVLCCTISLVAGEVPPPKKLPCFPGAYYRKAVSSDEVWTGIEGAVTLPHIEFDASRRRPDKPQQFLDNPSIYVGGRAKEREIDAGVTWEVVREPDGRESAQRKAFRPFWRNQKWHSAPAEPQFYYYPGDTIRISCRTTDQNQLTLEIALLSRAGDAVPEADAEPISVFRTDFDAEHFGPGNVQQFKRVNAIDQVGNEGKKAAPTATKVTGAVWHECFLLRGEEKLPMTPQRFTDMRCPDPQLITVSEGGDPTRGGEAISLSGGKD